MSLRWHVAQAVRNREIAASLSVAGFKFEAYVPMINKRRKVGHMVVVVPTPRFGTYIFLRFDRELDNWGALCRKEHRIARERYFERVLCDADGRPASVPDLVMDAIRAYQPPTPQEPAMPHVYRTGERVSCIIAGVRREAVFVEYCGTRPFIRTWIFGADRVTEVSSAELEPLDLDCDATLPVQAM